MQPIVDTSRTSTLMVCPDYFFAKVGDIETDFAHTIHVRETVPPIVILFYRLIPEVIEVGLIITGTSIALMTFIIVSTHIAICH